MVDHADHFKGRKLAGYVRVSAANKCVDAQRGTAAQMEAVKWTLGMCGEIIPVAMRNASRRVLWVPLVPQMAVWLPWSGPGPQHALDGWEIQSYRGEENGNSRGTKVGIVCQGS